MARFPILLCAVLALALSGCTGHAQLGGQQFGASLGPAETLEAGPVPAELAPVYEAVAKRIESAQDDESAARLAEALSDEGGCALGAGRVRLERSSTEEAGGGGSFDSSATSGDSQADTSRSEQLPGAEFCGPVAWAKSGSAGGGLWSALSNLGMAGFAAWLASHGVPGF